MRVRVTARPVPRRPGGSRAPVRPEEGTSTPALPPAGPSAPPPTSGPSRSSGPGANVCVGLRVRLGTAGSRRDAGAVRRAAGLPQGPDLRGRRWRRGRRRDPLARPSRAPPGPEAAPRRLARREARAAHGRVARVAAEARDGDAPLQGAAGLQAEVHGAGTAGRAGVAYAQGERPVRKGRTAWRGSRRGTSARGGKKATGLGGPGVWEAAPTRRAGSARDPTVGP